MSNWKTLRNRWHASSHMVARKHHLNNRRKIKGLAWRHWAYRTGVIDRRDYRRALGNKRMALKLLRNQFPNGKYRPSWKTRYLYTGQRNYWHKHNKGRRTRKNFYAYNKRFKDNYKARARQWTEPSYWGRWYELRTGVRR